MRCRTLPAGLILGLVACGFAVADDSGSDVAEENNPHSVVLDAAPENQSLPLEELQMFADVFNQIRQGYVESVPDSELFELAVQGMLSGLDPHSVFLQEKAYDSLQETTQGEFSGLGIEIGQDRGYISIIAPIDGSPAEAAGLRAGDIILKIDGESIRDLPVNKSVEKMRGPTGSEVLLTIGRRGVADPFDVTVVRDIIKVPSVRSRELMEGYLWLRASQFQRGHWARGDRHAWRKPAGRRGLLKGRRHWICATTLVRRARCERRHGRCAVLRRRLGGVHRRPSSASRRSAIEAAPGDMLNGIRRSWC